MFQECRLRVKALLAGEAEGQRRLLEASERKDNWIAKQIEESHAEPTSAKATCGDDSEGGKRAIEAAKLENIEDAPASVRAALLGKRNDDELERVVSTAEDGIAVEMCIAEAEASALAMDIDAARR